MLKEKKDNVFELVKSLNKAEKRQFKLYASRFDKNLSSKFVALFDFLNKSDVYDEQKLLEKKFVKKEQLSNVKANLYKQILTSLRNAASANSIKLQITEQINNAQILYDKGIYLQSLKLLDKAKTMAYDYEFFNLVFLIIDFEKTIEAQYITRSEPDRAIKLIEETLNIKKIINNIDELSNLALKLYDFILKNGFVKDDRELEYVKLIFTSKIPETFVLAEASFLEKLWYFKCNIRYFYITQNFVNCYKYAQRLIDLFENNRKMTLIHPVFFLKAYNAILESLFFMWQTEKHLLTLNNLSQTIDNEEIRLNGNSLVLAFLYENTAMLDSFILNCNFEKAEKLIEEIKVELPNYKYKLDKHHTIQFNYKFACIYFALEKYEKCAEYLKLVYNEKITHIREDIKCYAKFLNLIAVYELEMTDVIDIQLKSTYKYLLQKNDLSEVQSTIIEFFKELPKIYPNELPKKFKALRNKLLPFINHPYEKRVFNYLDIVSWLESKIENKPLIEIIKRRRLNL